MSKKIAEFEKLNGSTFSIIEEFMDNWKECECCKMQSECYITLSMRDRLWDLCPDCLYTITYGEG